MAFCWFRLQFVSNVRRMFELDTKLPEMDSSLALNVSVPKWSIVSFGAILEIPRCTPMRLPLLSVDLQEPSFPDMVLCIRAFCLQNRGIWFLVRLRYAESVHSDMASVSNNKSEIAQLIFSKQSYSFPKGCRCNPHEYCPVEYCRKTAPLSQQWIFCRGWWN